MHWLDRLSEHSARVLAQQTSRRSTLSRLGALLVGTTVFPVLPVARAAGGGDPVMSDDPTDSTSCAYWRYCGMDGFLCTCCGGDVHTCPPGTEPSPVTWVGTCRNPNDGKDYIISYNDCCGKGGCGRCFCNRNEGDKPLYHPTLANDYNWCLGTQVGHSYHCSAAVVLGPAV